MIYGYKHLQVRVHALISHVSSWTPEEELITDHQRELCATVNTWQAVEPGPT